MAKGFRKSKLAFWGIMCLGVLLSVLLWIRDRNYPLYIPIIASTLSLLIGYFAACVVRNLIANSLTTQYLGYLHMELDPDKFITAYGPVPDRLTEGSRDRAVAHAYLADGYGAKGDFAAALSLLEKGFDKVDLSDAALRGLYLSNKGTYQSALGDLVQAKESAASLRQLIDGCWRSKNALARNLQDSWLLLDADIALQEDRLPDKKALEELYGRCAYNLRRFEIDRLLTLRALAVGDKAEAKKHLELLKEHGGKTRYTAWAEEQLKAC